MSARGCAASISGDPMTNTIEVANGMSSKGKAARSDIDSISAMAIAPPAAPATMNARVILRSERPWFRNERPPKSSGRQLGGAAARGSCR
jgi:hypothetical protein